MLAFYEYTKTGGESNLGEKLTSSTDVGTQHHLMRLNVVVAGHESDWRSEDCDSLHRASYIYQALIFSSHKIRGLMARMRLRVEDWSRSHKMAESRFLLQIRYCRHQFHPLREKYFNSRMYIVNHFQPWLLLVTISFSPLNFTCRTWPHRKRVFLCPLIWFVS